MRNECAESEQVRAAVLPDRCRASIKVANGQEKKSGSSTHIF